MEKILNVVKIFQKDSDTEGVFGNIFHSSREQITPMWFKFVPEQHKIKNSIQILLWHQHMWESNIEQILSFFPSLYPFSPLFPSLSSFSFWIYHCYQKYDNIIIPLIHFIIINIY